MLETLAATLPARESRRFSYDELVRTVPESNLPSELWDGEFSMSPAPSYYHQDIIARLTEILTAWASREKAGIVRFAPLDVVLSPRFCVQPDIIFISTARKHMVRRQIQGAPDLVVEVLSESNWQHDKIEKKALYEQFGIQEYWIVDPDSRMVEIWTMRNGEYSLHGRWNKSGFANSPLLAGLQADLELIFAGLDEFSED